MILFIFNQSFHFLVSTNFYTGKISKKANFKHFRYMKYNRQLRDLKPYVSFHTKIFKKYFSSCSEQFRYSLFEHQIDLTPLCWNINASSRLLTLTIIIDQNYNKQCNIYPISAIKKWKKNFNSISIFQNAKVAVFDEVKRLMVEKTWVRCKSIIKRSH